MDNLKNFESLKLPESVAVGSTTFKAGTPLANFILYAQQMRRWLDEAYIRCRSLQIELSQKKAIIESLRSRLGE